ncbi:MAG: 50S ribosomal protein L4, large subunit ribosomal protein L4 [candidate division WS6 bacterium GW2011_GWC1_36_11]|uniref:Large ribosomal subunit protein uL4 n=3 Tax=Candidatus Dojkabacteria TaxID=74243 RepID=A0A0G0G0D4_9BACT|nr:MAG: 50S ribosomal protein L4, large subunit ribosomal protein L4 [candidate division WS6 bacterium GW2011_GWC1_36_11]KKQ04262.1 MAG: 50S ribosomal protein L4 [candidate division WS6 bacterium GW2011_WS6_36_26]KKQ11155.1 MAG: 50S ribosomal protein L4 [candidate division WS6 bacterium GW2011_GWE1_36_69]KKQ11619.1 MAG: 50S ribosomal protein L4 [candidate division WS6 bacterium GW2011_GWC2_36_7]KKQ16233.1 MAG: 50S ribosomal protein L4 [candidate division WS6 bacterium GW2011_GWF1_36_8]HAM37485
MEKTKVTTTTTKEVKPKAQEVKLNPIVWEAPFNGDLVAQVLYVYMSNERKGTSNAKTRGDVRGGGRKPWKQKGTGRARVGSTRSPLWVGGGVTFTPNDKNWSKKINKQMARKATCIMLSERLRNEVLNFVTMPKEEIRKALEEKVGKKALVITNNVEVKRSLNNVEDITVITPAKINTKHLVSARNILVDQDAVKILEERLTNGK